MRFSLLRLLLPSLLVLRLIPVAHAQASIPVSELEAARAATERFGPEARVLWHPVRRVPAALLGLDVPVPGRTAEERATALGPRGAPSPKRPASRGPQETGLRRGSGRRW